MNAKYIEDLVGAWARLDKDIEAVILFGSQARGCGDALSDWDFHIIARHTQFAATREWTAYLGLGFPKVYAFRDGVVGKVTRITAIWPGADMDFVVLPSAQLKLARLAMRLGMHRRSERLRRRLADLALVIRPGHRFLYGEAEWGGFYRQVRDEIPDPVLAPEELRRKAELFVADYLWVLRKIERGELCAAQRVLHRSLAETNYALLCELRRRKGQDAWPEARRLERWASVEEYEAFSVSVRPEREELKRALDKSCAAFRRLVNDLLGDQWSWPGDLEAGEDDSGKKDQVLRG